MNTAQLEALRASNRRSFARPVDISQSEPDDSHFMATLAAVAADPSTLTYEELVAAAIMVDDTAAYSLMADVMIV